MSDNVKGREKVSCNTIAETKFSSHLLTNGRIGCLYLAISISLMQAEYICYISKYNSYCFFKTSNIYGKQKLMNGPRLFAVLIGICIVCTLLQEY